LEFLAQDGLKEFFTVCAYTCYDLVRPDKVMELAWRYGMSDFAMPFFIQMVSELTKKVEKVEKKNEEREKKEEKKKEEEITQSLEMGPTFMGGLVSDSGMPMLMGPGMGMSSSMGMGGLGGMGGGFGGY
jgi:clathrin heavy chain